MKFTPYIVDGCGRDVVPGIVVQKKCILLGIKWQWVEVFRYKFVVDGMGWREVDVEIKIKDAFWCDTAHIADSHASLSVLRR
jgi:hypothetical protein